MNLKNLMSGFSHREKLKYFMDVIAILMGKIERIVRRKTY